MIEINDKHDLRMFTIKAFKEVHNDIIFQKLGKFQPNLDKSVMYALQTYLDISIKSLMSESNKHRDLGVFFNDLEITEPLKAFNRLDFFKLYYNDYLLEIDDETFYNFINQFITLVNKDNFEKLNRGEVFTHVDIKLYKLGTRYLGDNYTTGKSFEAICVAILENVKSQLNKFE